MKYVLMWATVKDGLQWLPYSDTPEGRAALQNALRQMMGYGVYLLWWKLFREDTQAIFDSVTAQPKGGEGGGLDC